MTEEEANKIGDLALGIADSYFRDHFVASFNEAGFGWVLFPSKGKDEFSEMVTGYVALKVF